MKKSTKKISHLVKTLHIGTRDGMNDNQLPLVALFLLALTTSGCTIRGESEFTCPDPQEGICVDSHTAMLLAEQGKTAKNISDKHIGHVSSTEDSHDGHEHFHDEDKHDSGRDAVQDKTGLHGLDQVSAKGNALDAGSSSYSNVAPIAGTMRLPVEQPKPILKQATVLEVYVSAWEDENAVLHMPTSSYVEITPRTWSLTDTSIEQYRTQGPFVEIPPPSQADDVRQ